MMKLVIDERVKHRLIGLAVILSIGAIFAPAIMKKSSQRFDNVSVAVELPAKPAHPDITIAERKEMFEATKIAQVELPEVKKEQPKSNLSKAESLSQMNEQEQLVQAEPVATTVTKVIENEDPSFNLTPPPKEDLGMIKGKQAPLVSVTKVAAIKKVARAATAVTPAKPKSKVVVNNLAKNNAKKTKLIKPLSKNVITAGYAVQLATFTKQQNADSLVSKLKVKGYAATYNKVKTNGGMVYKVIVGNLNEREQAKQLQQRLAEAIQIKGFIVKQGQG